MLGCCSFADGFFALTSVFRHKAQSDLGQSPEKEQENGIEIKKSLVQLSLVTIVGKLKQEGSLPRRRVMRWREGLPDGRDDAKLLILVEHELKLARRYPHSIGNPKHAFEAYSFLASVARGVILAALGAASDGRDGPHMLGLKSVLVAIDPEEPAIGGQRQGWLIRGGSIMIVVGVLQKLKNAMGRDIVELGRQAGQRKSETCASRRTTWERRVGCD